jgi:hypothetical protein
MKNILIVGALACALLSPKAEAQSMEDILGAIAGYQLGNSVGDGDGRKAARVVGAVLGYRYGEQVLNNNSDITYGQRHRDSYVEYNGLTRNQYRIQNYCRSQVPPKYKINHGVERSWINGCIARVEQAQAQMEMDAYNDGIDHNIGK